MKLRFQGRIAALIGCSIASWCLGALAFGVMGQMTPIWMEMFHVGKGLVGLSMTALICSLGVFMFLAGRWSDEAGSRVVISTGTILAGGAALGFAYARNIYLLCAHAIILGAASSLVYVPSLSCVQKWWPKRRGMASGVLSLAFGISAALMVPLFNRWLESYGYFSTMLRISLLTFVVGTLFAQFTESPRDNLAEQAISGNALAAVGLSRSITASGALRTRTFWLIWAIWALGGASGAGMIMLCMPVCQDLGFTSAQGALALGIFNLTNGLSRLVNGVLSDRFGRRTIMALTFMSGAGAYFLLLFAKGFVTLVIPLAFIGGSFGTLFALSSPLIMEYFGERYFGAILGLVFTAYAFFSSWAGPFLGGLLRDLSGSYTATFIYLGTFLALSAVLLAWAKPPQRV